MATEFTPLASLAGGALIGAAAVVLWGTTGRVAGISGIVRRLLPPYAGAAPLQAVSFLIGLGAAALVWRLGLGLPVYQTVPASSSQAVAAGVLVGFGAILGSGCTSGHGVCGLSRLSIRSLAATLTFMSVAAGVVFVLRHVVGGWPWP